MTDSVRRVSPLPLLPLVTPSSPSPSPSPSQVRVRTLSNQHDLTLTDDLTRQLGRHRRRPQEAHCSSDGNQAVRPLPLSLPAHELMRWWSGSEKIILKKWYTIYKDHITLSDYEVSFEHLGERNWADGEGVGGRSMMGCRLRCSRLEMTGE